MPKIQQNMGRFTFQEGKKYTFSDYFEMDHPTEEIVAALGYSLHLRAIQFPQDQKRDTTRIQRLRDSYYELLPKITITSEIAKREFMIAPLLYEVIRQIDARLHVDYPIDVDEHLSGSVDYLICAAQELVIVEAKRGDLDRGFNQLAAELIAVDLYEDPQPLHKVYGAITIGEVWKFALLEREKKQLIKDIHTLRYPEDIEEIFAIVYGILTH